MERRICRVMFSTLILAGTTLSDDGYPESNPIFLAFIIGVPIVLIISICYCIYFFCRFLCAYYCGKSLSAQEQALVSLQSVPQQLPFMVMPQQQVPYVPLPK